MSIFPTVNERVYPMSSGQEALWLQDKIQHRDVPLYVVPWVHRLRGRIRPEALEAALTAVVARHEPLRTVLRDTQGKPEQAVAPVAQVRLEQRHLGKAEEVDGAVREALSHPIPLDAAPLLRAELVWLAHDDAILVVAIHHAAVDGWSLGVLDRDFEAAFAVDRAERADWPSLPISYGAHSAGQRQAEAEQRDGLLDRWRDRLDGLPEECTFPLDRPRPSRMSQRGGRVALDVDPATWTAVRALARRSRATPFTVLLAALQVLLSRHGAADTVIGTPVARREHEELESLVGYFVNPVVLRRRTEPQESFAEAVQAARGVLRDAVDGAGLPFHELVRELSPARSLARTPLFQVMLVLEDQTGPGLSLPGLEVEVLDVHNGTSKYDLTFSFTPRADRAHLAIEFATDLFDRATVERLGARLLTLLAAAATDPDCEIRRLSILPPTEREQLLAFGTPATPASENSALAHELVAAQAVRTPDAPAVHADDRALTYAELDAAATELSLAVSGHPGDVVAVCVDRTPELAITVLAVLKAGRAYLALDPAYPHERLSFMLRDSGARLLLTQESLVGRLPEAPGVHTLLVDQPLDPEGAVGTPRRAAADDLAYLIYTSGSTGIPKAVEMPHRPLADLLAWSRTSSAAGEGTPTLQFAALSFDVAFQELFATWSTGGVLVLVDEATRRDPDRLLAHIEANRVERLFLPFVALQQLAEHAVSSGRFPSSIREVLTAGEQLHATPGLRRFFEALPGARLENQYGPSETHVVTAEPLTDDPAAWEALPAIGRPVAGARVLVLDEELELQPVGVPGEICVGGTAVARGYRARPELTSERFVRDPHGNDADRLYRTGDVGAVLGDGRIRFLGRRDGQVKIRGYRVELGEVEAALRSMAGVQDAVVVAGEQPGGGRRLVGYVKPAPGEHLQARQLRRALRGSLPDHMLPSAVVPIEAFPLTPSGKVDRRGLAERPLVAETGTGTQRTAPRDAAELRLCDLWAKVLGLPQVGIDEDFFELGGDSFLGLTLLSELRERTGHEVDLADLMAAPTVARMCERLRGDGALHGSSIVPIRATGETAPLFCFHPLPGTVIRYAALAAALGARHPVYGLQSRGLDPDVEPDATVEAMTAHYVEAICAAQPSGPYHLIGYSMGGILAFEAARQLRAAGRRVGLLGMIDTSPSFDLGDDSDYAIRILARFGLRIDVDVDALLEMDPVLRVEVLLERGLQAGSLPAGYDGRRLRRMLELYEYNGNALVGYSPQPLDETVVLYRALDRGMDMAPCERDHGWSRLVPEVVVHDIPGDHFHMMEPENVHVIAGHVARVLGQAPAE